jgi:23S rRNA (adenine2503-C2)-methyltransferase
VLGRGDLNHRAVNNRGVQLPDPLNLTAPAYTQACRALGIKGGLAGAEDRYKAFYRQGLIDQAHFAADIPPISRTHESESAEGAVVKFCLKVPPAVSGAPDLETESVIIPMIGRKGHLTHTLCVSSQVGCAMGCVFCQTAQMGKVRDLLPREIVAQWWVARHVVGCTTIRNVVFMGMGEPTDNLGNVIGACEILADHAGPNLPANKLTVSTVGKVDGIRRLAEHVNTPGWHRFNLAVSLNAPTDEIRSAIMPINRSAPLATLREAIEAWPIYGAAKICFEYVLIPGVNDRPEHAVLVGDYLLGRGEYAGRPALPGLLNLIPYNPRENSPWPAPSEGDVVAFLGALLETGVYAKRRRTKGRDTMAACGQLGNLEHRRRPAKVTVTVAGS